MEYSFGAVVYTMEPAGSSRGAMPFYLLVLHSGGGHWGLPKGHPLPGESPEATVSREVHEEAGCTVRIVPGFSDSVSYTVPTGTRKQVDFVLARVKTTGAVILPNAEIRAVGWFSFDEVLGVVTYEECRQVIVHAHGFLAGTAQALDS